MSQKCQNAVRVNEGPPVFLFATYMTISFDCNPYKVPKKKIAVVVFDFIF